MDAVTMALMHPMPTEEMNKSLITWQVFLEAIASFIYENSYDLPSLIID